MSSQPQVSIVAIGKADYISFEMKGHEATDGVRRMKIAVLWASPDRTTANGVWEGQPCTVRIDDHPFDEAFFVVTGRMTVTPNGGSPHDVGPGDIVVFPRGSGNIIQYHDAVTKFWTAYAADGLPEDLFPATS